MSRTGTMGLRVEEVPFGATPIGGELLRRIESGEAPADYPLFDAGAAGGGSSGARGGEAASWPGGSAFMDRPRLADLLIESNAAMGNALPGSTIEALRGEGALVITGQQPGLWTGPGYALWKAMTVIGLAERLAASTGRPVLPAFWIASEDHDILEVNRATVGGSTFVADHPEAGGGAGHRPPVGRLSVAPWRGAMMDFLDRRLPDGPGRGAMLEAAEAADYSSYTSQFASMLRAMAGEGRLVLVDPMELRPALAPALAGALERADAMVEAFDRGTARLREAGLEPPLERVGLFEFRDGVRKPAEVAAGQAARVRREPEAFSPGAALRPIVQDAAMPVLCTVAGPAELAYLWQVDPLHAVMAEAGGGRRSAVWPRMSATVLDAGAVERAAGFGLDGAAVFEARDRFKRFDPGRYDGGLDAEMAAIEAARDAWIERIEKMRGEGADRRVDRARASAEHQSAQVIRQVRLQRLERARLGRGRMRELADAVLPAGSPQERVACGIDLAARLGVERMRALTASIDMTRIAHRLVRIEPVS